MSEWISVKDGLPSSSGYYLVIFPWFGRYDEGHCRVMHFLKEAYGTPVNRWYDYELSKLITHWMPLPEPPKN